MDNTYTIIEDVFSDDRNQITEARGYVMRNHIPEDMRRQGEILASQMQRPRMSNSQVMQQYQQTRNGPPPHQYTGMINQQEPKELQNMEPQEQKESDKGMDLTEIRDRESRGYNRELRDIELREGQNYHNISCRDIFSHVEVCPICSSYFKKDVKFYWLIIIILVVVILLLTRNFTFGMSK